MNSVYAFQDTNRNTVMIDESNVNFTGTWSSSGTYVAADHDAAVYGASNYIAIVDNVGGVPTYVPRRGQPKWSALVLMRQGTNSGGHTADEAYALALAAQAQAVSAQSTANNAAGIAEDAEIVAGLALTTAWAGTAAASAAGGVADSAKVGADAAFAIAVAGTNAAASAAAGVNQLLSIITNGTSGGQATQQQAYAALLTAWSGTNGANAALAIASRGTNAAAIAEGHAATALTTAWAGTQAANQALNLANLLVTWFGTIGGVDGNSILQQGSNYAFGLYTTGTNFTTHYTDDQVRIAHQQADANAYGLFLAGTNYTNSVAFQSGSDSQLVFWAGTTYTNEKLGIETTARINGDNSIMAIAVAGTNAAALADAHAQAALTAAWAGTNNSVPLSGGTMTGNLRTPQIFLNSGSVGISALQNGTMYYDFLGPAFVETQVDASMTISAKNFTPGAEIAICLVSNGQQKAISYDAQFSFFGTQMPFTSQTAGKKILVPLACTGTVASKVLGATQPQL